MKLTKGDKVLIVILVIFSLVFSYYMATLNSDNYSNSEKYISVQVDGKEINKIQFSKKNIGEKIKIETEFGYNVLEIGDGELKIIDASCLDKLCVKQGTIKDVGQLLVCLPNRLVIEIKSENNNSDIDNFAF